MQRKQSRKPRWPYGKDKPRLTPYGNGQWGKKIKGVIYYFGVWADPVSSLTRYRREYGAIEETGQRGTAGSITVDELLNLYLSAKDERVAAGEMSARTFADYLAVCVFVKEYLGESTEVASLGPADFSRLQQSMKSGPVRRANEITWIKSIFRWAHASQLIPHLIAFGPEFVKPPAKAARKLKRLKGKKLYTAPQLRRLFLDAPNPLKAMIVLALNGGFGNTDCATLPLAAVDLSRRLIDYPRPKTEVERTLPLWPETVAAIRRALTVRPVVESPLLFLTHQRNAWVRSRAGENGQVIMDAIAGEFGKVCKAAGVPNLGFYTIRHTFRTVADATLDQHAIHRIMGHSLPGLSATYVEHISMARLRKVTDHVRQWFRRNDGTEEDDVPATPPLLSRKAR